MIPLLNSKKKLTDTDLINNFAKTKNPEFLGELYIRYHHLVYLGCQKYLKNKEESKDAVNDIFQNLIDTLRKQEIQNFKSWLYIVTKNHCLMKIRSKKEPLTIMDSTSLEEQIMENPDFHHPNNESELKEDKLKNALSLLPHDQKKCLTMFYFANKSYKDIAHEIGYDLRQVKSHIQNGKRNLKNILSNNGNSHE